MVSINDDVQTAVEAGEHLVDAGFSADTAVTREQTEGLIRQLNRLDERARSRECDLEAMLEKLQEFTKNHNAVMDDIVQVRIYCESEIVSGSTFYYGMRCRLAKKFLA